MNIKTPPMPEPDFTINWRGWGCTVTKPAVGDTNVYTTDQLTARDAQWLEMVRPVVEASSRVLDWLDSPSDSALSDSEMKAFRAALRNITED